MNGNLVPSIKFNKENSKLLLVPGVCIIVNCFFSTKLSVIVRQAQYLCVINAGVRNHQSIPPLLIKLRITTSGGLKIKIYLLMRFITMLLTELQSYLILWRKICKIKFPCSQKLNPMMLTARSLQNTMTDMAKIRKSFMRAPSPLLVWTPQ